MNQNEVKFDPKDPVHVNDIKGLILGTDQHPRPRLRYILEQGYSNVVSMAIHHMAVEYINLNHM